MLIKSLNFNRNYYFFIGIVFGVLLSLFVPNEIKDIKYECAENLENINDKFNDEFEPHLNLEQKPMQAKKTAKNIIRPRYYSSELGIREKLFIGIMTTQDNIDNLATAFNKTTAHLVNKIKFFINADNVKSNFNLKNIVGFTDTRENLRPFHILKYIADNYLDDYDYFLIVTDSAYIDVRSLKDKLYHISISFDLYMGHPIDINDLNSDNERNYCDLNAGIVLSSSVIRKIRSNLDWCVRNSVTNMHNLNIGRCVKYSSKIDECQPSWQGINITSYKLKSHKIYRDLRFLKHDPNFNTATSIYPITTPDDFYLLHAYFSRLHLETIRVKSLTLEKEAYLISNGSVSNEILEIRWPLGVPAPTIPETRHDLLTWTYLNLTHSYMWDADNNVKLLTKIESDDINRVIKKILVRVQDKEDYLQYVDVHSIYRRFDPVRGMDYQIHLNFINKKTNQPILKSYEIVKPLGSVEIVPSPYVTESTRIAILLPVFEHQLMEANNFIKRYEKICMENQDNTFLMLIFIYHAETPSKGDEDIFNNLKNIALTLSEKYKTDGSRIAWVSIRLPSEINQTFNYNDITINTIYGKNEILSLAAVDLALRKIGLESLVMVCSNSMTFRADFLNRVRMNTIQGFQVYSPIGFMMYPCKWTALCKECDTCDVSQSSGYFDRINYDVVSFYSRDYVEARKKLELILPIVRSDKDILDLLISKNNNIKTIIDLFIKSYNPIHVLRAIEPNLRFGNSLNNFLEINDNLPVCPYRDNNDETEESDKCIRIGSKKLIGDALVHYEEEILAKQ